MIGCITARRVCQRLFTKSFRGGSRPYLTQVTPPSEVSSGWRWICRFVTKTAVVGLICYAYDVGGHRSFECTPLVEHINSKKVDGRSAKGEIFMVHGANGEMLIGQVLGTKP